MPSFFSRYCPVCNPSFKDFLSWRTDHEDIRKAVWLQDTPTHQVSRHCEKKAFHSHTHTHTDTKKKKTANSSPIVCTHNNKKAVSMLQSRNVHSDKQKWTWQSTAGRLFVPILASYINTPEGQGKRRISGVPTLLICTAGISLIIKRERSK